MTCTSCVNNIETNISKIKGVLKVDVSLDKKEAIVIYDLSRAHKSVIFDKLDDLGFDCVELEETDTPFEYDQNCLNDCESINEGDFNLNPNKQVNFHKLNILFE